MNSIKLKSYTGENIANFCTAILVDAERHESSGAFKNEQPEYITHIFEDTFDSRYRLWKIHKYKKVTEFIKKLNACDMYVISPEYIINYESLVQEATRGHRGIVDSKRWELDNGE